MLMRPSEAGRSPLVWRFEPVCRNCMHARRPVIKNSWLSVTQKLQLTPTTESDSRYDRTKEVACISGYHDIV